MPEPTNIELAALTAARDYERLLRSMVKPQPNGIPSAEQLGTAVASMAECYTGVKEIKYSNRGYLVDTFAAGLGIPSGQPWCMTFVQYVFKQVSDTFHMQDLLPYDTASTQSFANWAEKEGLATIDVKKATRGSLIVFSLGKRPRVGHIEILTEVGATWYNSIGGNTDDGDSMNGGAVCKHERRAWFAYGPIGVARVVDGAARRWTRCIVPIEGLVQKYGKRKAVVA
jgi:hypothetical protein